MAQTKRKRRTKHRGNAAGSDRGSRPHRPQADRRGAEGGGPQRCARPPGGQAADLEQRRAEGRARWPCCCSSLTQFGILGNDASVSQGIFLSALALVIYTPLAYMTDKWVYGRQQRAKAAKKS